LEDPVCDDHPQGNGVAARAAQRSRATMQVNALRDEYATLRAEILQSIDVQQRHLSFGGAISGVVLLAAAQFFEHSRTASIAILIAGAPVVIYVTLVLWLSEVTRMFRVAAFLRGVERRVNELCGASVLGWENYLEKQRSIARAKRSIVGGIVELSQFYVIAVALFVVASSSLALGLYLWSPPASGPLYVAVAIVAVAGGWYLVHLARQLQRTSRCPGTRAGTVSVEEARRLHQAAQICD
jgi:hypothetical protein